MLLMDGNLLVYADREETTDHSADRNWGEDTINRGSLVWGVRVGAQWLSARGHPSESVAHSIAPGSQRLKTRKLVWEVA